jgi:hypothetical protein
VSAAAREPFTLEPVEHVVERAREVGHFGDGAAHRDAAAGLGGVDAPHDCRELLEWFEDTPQQHHVHGRDDHDADGKGDEFGEGQRGAHRCGRDDERRGGGHEQARVDQHDSPEERHATSISAGRRVFHGSQSPFAPRRDAYADGR